MCCNVNVYPLKSLNISIPRTQTTLVLLGGKDLVLALLTFKDRGHWSHRYIDFQVLFIVKVAKWCQTQPFLPIATHRSLSSLLLISFPSLQYTCLASW